MPERPQLQPEQQPDGEEELEELLDNDPLLLQKTLDEILEENQKYQKIILRLRQDVRNEKQRNKQLRKKLTERKDPYQSLLDAIGIGLLLATAAAFISVAQLILPGFEYYLMFAYFVIGLALIFIPRIFK